MENNEQYLETLEEKAKKREQSKKKKKMKVSGKKAFELQRIIKEKKSFKGSG